MKSPAPPLGVAEGPGLAVTGPEHPTDPTGLGSAPRAASTPGMHAGDDVPPSLRAWDRYRILALLGVGGMGRVYRAEDPQLRRQVALKFLRGGDPALEMRFEHEAQAQARVQHRNVCAVYEVGRHDGQPYIAMQLINGRTLREVAPDLSLREKVQVMRDVADAVHLAHKQALVHRDVKPANILVERTEGAWVPYVTDFGLARDMSGPGMTQAGAIIGTPQYMAPEQARGELEKLDARTDVYGLGATLYDLLAGAPPFPGTSNLQTLYKTRW
jgi:serine/threonine-protein kinase